MMTAEGGTGQLEAASLGTSPAARSMSALFHTHGNKHKHACAAHTHNEKGNRRAMRPHDVVDAYFFLYYQHLCRTQP